MESAKYKNSLIIIIIIIIIIINLVLFHQQACALINAHALFTNSLIVKQTLMHSNQISRTLHQISYSFINTHALLSYLVRSS